MIVTTLTVVGGIKRRFDCTWRGFRPRSRGQEVIRCGLQSRDRQVGTGSARVPATIRPWARCGEHVAASYRAL